MTEMNQEPNVEETKVQDVKAAETEEVQENAEVETVVTEQGEAAVKPKTSLLRLSTISSRFLQDSLPSVRKSSAV